MIREMRWVLPFLLVAHLMAPRAGGTLVENESIVHVGPIEAVALGESRQLSVRLIPQGADWDPIIAAEPAGTTFIVESGVHYEQTADLKDGDALIGQPGAVMDGETSPPGRFNRTEPTTSPSRAWRSAITTLTICMRPSRLEPTRGRRGASAGRSRTVTCITTAIPDWPSPTGRSPVTTRSMTTASSASRSPGCGSCGALVEGNEIYGNNTTGADEYYEAGGSKFGETENLIVRDNFVHDNNGPGLWTDIDNINTLYENNVVVGNSGAGIFHEISYSATIRNNQVRGNGFRNRGWLWEGGIMVAGSQDVEIYGNILEDNYNGITLIQQDRGSGALGPYLLRNVSVHDNTVVRSGRTGRGPRRWRPIHIHHPEHHLPEQRLRGCRRVLMGRPIVGLATVARLRNGPHGDHQMRV